MAFIAVQIRFVQLRWIGTTFCLVSIAVSLFVMIAAAFASDSRNGMLDVEANRSFLIWQKILVLCILSLFLVFGLQTFLGT